MKRVVFALLTVFCVFAVYQWGSDLADEAYLFKLEKVWAAPSPFVQEKVLERQLVYDGGHVRVLYNYKPILKGHLLIIPKRDAERLEDLTEEEWTELRETILLMKEAFEGAYHTSDYMLILQNGRYAGQTVPHLHFHMIPRDDRAILFVKLEIWSSFFTKALGLQPSLSDEELQAEVNNLRKYLPGKGHEHT